MTPGLFEHHTLILLDTEKFFFFFYLLNSLFFFWQFLLSVKLGAAMVSSADVSLHGVQGGKGSAWILLPAGSTSFPLDRSLNAAADFKDI